MRHEARSRDGLQAMKALVMGAGGFVGRWLVAHLGGSVVVALDHRGLDVTDAAAVSKRVTAERSGALCHLAAISSPRETLRALSAAFRAAVVGTLNIPEAIRAHTPRCVVLIPGSALAYARARLEDLPLREGHPLEPRPTYAASKIAEEAVARSYTFTFWLRVVVTRSFNRVGPGQGNEFLVTALAAQILRGGTLHVGNVHVARDFTDVRDVVCAYRLLVLRGEPGVPYNVCSERAVTILQIVDRIAQAQHVEVERVVNAGRARPLEPLADIIETLRGGAPA